MRVPDVLGVLAGLVAVVLLAVQEGDDERIFEANLERVRAFIRLSGATNQMISKHRHAARAVDERVTRLDHRYRVLRRHHDRGSLHPFLARIDQFADGALDRIERAEPQRPGLQECT
jgi:hypothetical protein